MEPDPGHGGRAILRIDAVGWLPVDSSLTAITHAPPPAITAPTRRGQLIIIPHRTAMTEGSATLARAAMTFKHAHSHTGRRQARTSSPSHGADGSLGSYFRGRTGLTNPHDHYGTNYGLLHAKHHRDSAIDPPGSNAGSWRYSRDFQRDTVLERAALVR